MPTTLTPRPCSQVPCRTLAAPHSSRCPVHQRAHQHGVSRRHDVTQPGASRRGRGRRWVRFRWSFLSRHVMCFDCLAEGQKYPQMSREVHHLKSLASGGLVYSSSNCIGLCVEHHRLRTNEERKKIV